MQTDVQLSYPAQLFWEWEMFPTNVVEKIKTHVLYSITFVSTVVPFMIHNGKLF